MKRQQLRSSGCGRAAAARSSRAGERGRGLPLPSGRCGGAPREALAVRSQRLRDCRRCGLGAAREPESPATSESCKRVAKCNKRKHHAAAEAIGLPRRFPAERGGGRLGAPSIRVGAPNQTAVAMTVGTGGWEGRGGRERGRGREAEKDPRVRRNATRAGEEGRRG